MRAKDYLAQVPYIDYKIKEKREHARLIKERAMKTTGGLSPDKVQTSGSKDKLGDAVSLYASIEAAIAALEAEKQAIVDTIHLLPPDESAVIEQNYVDGKVLRVIAYDLGKSYSWVTKKASKGIRGLQRILDRKEKGRA